MGWGAGRVYDVKNGPAFVSYWMVGFQHVWIDYWIEAVGLLLELQFKDVSLLCNKVASWSIQEFKSYVSYRPWFVFNKD